MTCDSCPLRAPLTNECRANPPMPIPIPVGPGRMEMHWYPPAHTDGWCARHPDRVALYEKACAEAKARLG